MKKLFPFLLALALLLTACADDRPALSSSSEASNPPVSSEASALPQEPTPIPAPTESASGLLESQPAGKLEEAAQNNVLIAYFTLPEDVDTTGADAISGASIIIRDGAKLGSCEFVAKTIQTAIGGDLFQIQTVQQYPLDHDPLVDYAAEEKAQGARPELAAQVENIAQYDIIILGYPNWWADLPMPVYTFLEEYDLTGKTIIPFVTHGGSGFSNTVNTIAALQPGATVSENTLSISRGDVLSSEETVTTWAQSLNLN